jgi:radical SAM superfamily enzyme YgiQ (UPF0313 family)
VKILLLNPPSRDGAPMVKEGRCMQRKGAWGYVMSPVTLVTTATLLRDEGHDVSVMDCPADGTSFPAMWEAARRLAPELVLVNTSTPTIEDDVAATGALKEGCAPPPVTVLLGIHPSARPEDALRAGAVDACIVGEPELTARELAAALAAGGDLRAVDGLALRDASGAVVATRPRAPIADLDVLPLPDWSLVDTGNYRLPLSGRRFLLVNTSRGCPYRCTFCNAHVYYGRAPRRRSVAHVVRELTRDVEQFGVRDFMFWAEEFLLDREFALALCDAIVAAGLDVRWVCNSRVDCVDGEVLAAIRRAGCWNIAFGIESGDPEVLAGMRKQITPSQSHAAVTLAKRAGLQVTGHVIIGFPQDTRETIAATERFVGSLDLDFVQYYCAIPYPGTELYEDARANGWLTTTEWRQWEHNQSVLTYGHLSAAEIMALRRRLMRRWYLRPRRIAATLRNHVRTPSEAWAFLTSLGGFLRWM